MRWCTVTLNDELGRIERAEDVFELLDVPFDSKTLTVHRLPILRLFGRAIAGLEDQGLSPAELRARYAAALATVHAQFVPGASGGAPVVFGRDRALVSLGLGKGRRRVP